MSSDAQQLINEFSLYAYKAIENGDWRHYTIVLGRTYRDRIEKMLGAIAELPNHTGNEHATGIEKALKLVEEENNEIC